MKSLQVLFPALIVASFLLWACVSPSSEPSPDDPSAVSSSSDQDNPLDPGDSSSSSDDPQNPAPGNSSSSDDMSNPGRSSSSSSLSTPRSSSSSVVLVPGQYEKLTAANAKSGWGSRYWDGCKPHCSWRDKVDTTAVPFSVCKNCNINDEEIPAFTLSPDVNQYWTGYKGVQSSCDGGSAYTCFDMAPIAVTDSLAYAFVATASSNVSCGQCFQVQFDGGTHNGADQVKEAHRLLKGKTLIVMATNIGNDVSADGQFDILIPGGGVGLFDSFSKQLGVSKESLGNQYGGFLRTCQDQIGWDKPNSQYKQCVANKCQEIFGKDAKFADLLRGCEWFVDWFETADNPTYLYKAVECPSYFTETYPSSINKSKDTDISANGW